MKRTVRLRRLYEAAQRDRNTERFFDHFSRGLESGQITTTDYSIRELFEHFVPNGREMVDSWNPRHGGGGVTLQEAGDAVSSSAFSNISGQIIYNAILQGSQAEEFVFSSAVPNIPTNFNGEKIPGITGLGDGAEVVNEAEPYPHIGVGEDWIETPPTVKRGNIVPLTKEAIFFDRTGLLVRNASQVGQSLGLNKEKRIIDAVVDENVTAHRYKWKGTVIATYGDNSGNHTWDNLAASNGLVDWTDIDAAEQLMAAITDPYTGEPIVITPKDLIVTRQNLYTARRILNATEIRFGDGASASTQTIATNPITNTYRILSSQQLAARMATDTTWYLGDVARAFAYMENWPITVVQAPANSKDDFERDIVSQWKASERGAAATLEPRAMIKSTA